MVGFIAFYNTVTRFTAGFSVFYDTVPWFTAGSPVFYDRRCWAVKTRPSDRLLDYWAASPVDLLRFHPLRERAPTWRKTRPPRPRPRAVSPPAVSALERSASDGGRGARGREARAGVVSVWLGGPPPSCR